MGRSRQAQDAVEVGTTRLAQAVSAEPAVKTIKLAGGNSISRASPRKITIINSVTSTKDTTASSEVTKTLNENKEAIRQIIKARDHSNSNQMEEKKQISNSDYKMLRMKKISQQNQSGSQVRDNSLEHPTGRNDSSKRMIIFH